MNGKIDFSVAYAICCRNLMNRTWVRDTYQLTGEACTSNSVFEVIGLYEIMKVGLLTGPEVPASGQFPQPFYMFLGINSRQVTTKHLALTLSSVPHQPLWDDQVAHRTSASPSCSPSVKHSPLCRSTYLLPAQRCNCGPLADRASWAASFWADRIKNMIKIQKLCPK